MERLSQSSKRVAPMRGLSRGREALIVHGCTEVACADVCGHPAVRVGLRSRIVGRVRRDVSVPDPPARPCRSAARRLRCRPARLRRHRTRWVASEQVATEPFTLRWPIARCRPRTRRTAFRSIASGSPNCGRLRTTLRPSRWDLIICGLAATGQTEKLNKFFAVDVDPTSRQSTIGRLHQRNLINRGQ